MGESSLNMYWFNYGSRFELPEATEAQLDKLESIVLVSKGLGKEESGCGRKPSIRRFPPPR